MTSFAETTIEQAAIDWFTDPGYNCAFGPEVAWDGGFPGRSDCQETILAARL